MEANHYFKINGIETLIDEKESSSRYTTNMESLI